MPGERRVERESIAYIRFLFIALLVYAADQITKSLAQKTLTPDSSIPLINSVFHLTLLYNKGGAFGILKAHAPLFVTIAAICVLCIIFYLPRIRKGSPYTVIGIALVLGGILGNLTDRLRFGHVVDFLDFRIWPIFNVADSAITVGAALLLIQLLKKK